MCIPLYYSRYPIRSATLLDAVLSVPSLSRNTLSTSNIHRVRCPHHAATSLYPSHAAASVRAIFSYPRDVYTQYQDIRIGFPLPASYVYCRTAVISLVCFHAFHFASLRLRFGLRLNLPLFESLALVFRLLLPGLCCGLYHYY